MIVEHSSVRLKPWEKFVIDYGWRASKYDLSSVLAVPANEVLRLRATGACSPLDKAKQFHELYELWHGRPPTDSEWRKPEKVGSSSSYEWLQPEIALLASLVGTVSVAEVAAILTRRLQQITGDKRAKRNESAVQIRTNAIGLQAGDVTGGITVPDAGKEIGSINQVREAITAGQLRTFRIGRRLLIPYAVWQAWKAGRSHLPAGYIRLSDIRQELGIRSDKLSEFARMGFIPTALQHAVGSAGKKGNKNASWFIDQKVAKALVADRRAARPMPWHGKPIPENLRTTYKLWLERKHPVCCATCTQIWGATGIPRTYAEYQARYPGLAHGAKRHLTRKWDPGVTVTELAQSVGCSTSHVKRAIENGMLKASKYSGRRYISKTDAARWQARKCTTGQSQKSWISFETAGKQYAFSTKELLAFISSGQLKSKRIKNGPSYGETFVSRHQVGHLREALGFTLAQAAKKAHVSSKEFAALLEGVDWRRGEGIPLVTVQAAIKRKQSQHGFTVAEAAHRLGKPVSWVNECIEDGSVSLLRAAWAPERLYLSLPMLRRLEKLKEANMVRAERPDDHWLTLDAACIEAGVSQATLKGWVRHGALARKRFGERWRYHRDAIRSSARRFWKTVRFRRAKMPYWLAQPDLER